jgi:3-oxoacyl-[acyl-carrier protein] reductase
MAGNGKLAGKVALVTGGSRGIGGAIVVAFAENGADVAFCHREDGENALNTAAKIERLGRRCHVSDCDVADVKAALRMVAEAEDALGPIDILVNNAGINVNRPFEEILEAEFDEMMNVHFRSTFFISQACYRGMAERGWGRIINISSQLASKGAVNLTHYCAAKGAIAAFTRALAWEAAPKGVLVNAIAPGPVDTVLLKNLTDEWRAAKRAELPIGRFAEPEEIAPTAVLLASEDGSYYVGATLMPAGGDVMV